MKRAAVGVAAAVALLLPAVASASALHDAQLVRRGIAHAAQRGWLKPADAAAYRSSVARALADAARLPKLRAAVITAQLSQLTPLADSYIAPRALTLFSQLDANLSYLEGNRLPATQMDITDDDGIVYRWFPRFGFEFHPLANFGALNGLAARADAEGASTLANALVARGIPRGSRLIWEYEFPFGSGRPPWASGMAQAVAAQALARASALVGDPALGAAAVRASAAVPPLLLPLPGGPWIRLYGFSSSVVLNAQLQAVVSLLEYSRTAGDDAASALASELASSAAALLPRFDTGDWSRYELGGGYASLGYQKFVTDLLAKLADQTQDPFWIAASERFHAYYYDPPQVTQPSAPPEIWPQPLDGYLDTAPITIALSMRSSVSLSIAGKVATYRLNAGTRTITWKPPAGLAAGSYPVRVSAVSYAGHKATVALAPVVVHWETAPPQQLTAKREGTTLTWRAVDPGTPWLALAVDLVDPSGVAPPQTLDLGHQPVSGTLGLTLPPGTWQATLRAANSAALTAPYPLGTFTGAG